MRVLLLFSLLAWTLPSLADTATIAEGTRVNLRSGRAETYRIIKSLEPGTKVEIVNDDNGYVHVKTAAGDVGWLPTRMLKIETNTAHASAAPDPNPQIANLQAELAQMSAELVQSQSRQKKPSIGLVVSIGLGGLILGILLGMGGLQAYYQRRLKGLRI
jgi:uncharacterized protein YgiM (DUF1202 family)